MRHPRSDTMTTPADRSRLAAALPPSAWTPTDADRATADKRGRSESPITDAEWAVLRDLPATGGLSDRMVRAVARLRSATGRRLGVFA
jgi:hypothetical protein